jgi:CubicO group peptidase (beta-lactamase class C family)
MRRRARRSGQPLGPRPPRASHLNCPAMNRRQYLREISRAALGFSLLPLAGCGSLERSARQDATKLTVTDLERQIPQWLQEAKVPGLSIAIIDRGKLSWRRGFGVTSTTSRTPVTTDTIFTCCSMTKPVFAYFVMKLCEKGVLGLDEPLTKYAPERYLQGDSRLDLITARHCLSHTTGFQNWREEDGKPLSIHFPPGTKWSYSGEGYAYLASVVTRLMKQSLEDYMQKQVLSPFGMSSSAYLWNDAIARRMAWPHDSAGRPLPNNKRSTHESVARYGAAGDLLTTPTDYARFLIEVIDPKPSDEFRLSRESRDEMLRPHVPVPNAEQRSSWAIGWAIVHDGDHNYIYHSGDDAGWHAIGVASAANKSGFVAMTNGELGTQVLGKIFMSDFMQRLLKAGRQTVGRA